MTKTKQLNAQTAIIKTAAIEIKALTISGKQVTLAVFRQLPERQLIDYSTLKMNGIPWGIVNYHPDKCADNAEHIHVIWQDGQTLHRCAISKRSNISPYDDVIAEIASDLAVAVIQEKFLETWNYYNDGYKRKEELLLRGFKLAGGGVDGYQLRTLDYPGRNATSDECLSVVDIVSGHEEQIYDAQNYSVDVRFRSYLMNQHADWLKYTFPGYDLGGMLRIKWGHLILTDTRIRSGDHSWIRDFIAHPNQLSVEDCVSRLNDAYSVSNDWHHRRQSLYQSLCNLDQLYIAI